MKAMLGSITPLCERYERGEATLHIHFIDQLAFYGENIGRYCAQINAVGLGDKAVLPLNSALDSRLCRDDVENQGAMFVGITEGLENGEDVAVPLVESRVRLVVLDDCLNLRPRNASYLSIVTSSVLLLGGLVKKNRELRLEGEHPTLVQDQGAGQMVQDRAKLVQYVAGQNAETWADDPVSVEVLKRFLGVRIVIDALSVRCFAQKGFAFPFKLIDMLIGPL